MTALEKKVAGYSDFKLWHEAKKARGAHPQTPKVAREVAAHLAAIEAEAARRTPRVMV